jgi:hypothetical protein
MKRLIITLLIFPTLLFAQNKQKETTEKKKKKLMHGQEQVKNTKMK